MSLDSLLDSDLIVSNSACVALLFSSRAITSSIAALASKFFLANFFTTSSLFSLMYAICNIIYWILKAQIYEIGFR